MLDFVRQWLRKADSDLEAAGHLIAADSDFCAAAAFHAQQAVEKYLKAVLVRHQLDFPRTHDIDRLVDLVRTVDPGLGLIVEGAAILTPYGVEVRYPADLPEPTREEALEAVRLAGRVKRAVLEHLPRGNSVR